MSGARPVAPILVLAWGNRARGDDALGPLALDALRARWAALTEGDPARRDAVDFLEDHQLAVEHALDVVGRQAVLWIDASRDAAPPFAVQPLAPRRDPSFTSHALSPQAVLQVYADLHGTAPPPGWLLGIAGRDFGLGLAPGAEGLANLAAAVDWAAGWLAQALPGAAGPPG